jgi:hypothetical protein
VAALNFLAEMPIQPSMAQLSRPYQIGLVAIALLAAAWLLLFQGHHSSNASESSSAPPPAPTRTVKAPTAAPKAPSHRTAGQATGSGSASSLGAYGHAIEKARGAVATSQKNAKELDTKSAQASSTSTSTPSSNAAGSTTASSHAKSTAPSTSAATPTKETHTTTKSSAGAGSAVPTRQRTVEAQLKSGRIALIFFWNPSGSDDRAVHRALASLPHSLRFAIDEARPSEVASFGVITRGVQVFGTPTLLIANGKGQITTLTGLQDSFTIAQAIREARHS